MSAWAPRCSRGPAEWRGPDREKHGQGRGKPAGCQERDLGDQPTSY